jgi:hypothetical protein
MVPMQPRPQDYGMNMLPPQPAPGGIPSTGVRVGWNGQQHLIEPWMQSVNQSIQPGNSLSSIFQRSRMPNYEQGFNSSLLRGTAAPAGYTSTSGM